MKLKKFRVLLTVTLMLIIIASIPVLAATNEKVILNPTTDIVNGISVSVVN